MEEGIYLLDILELQLKKILQEWKRRLIMILK
jgi:hypothetical protein